jgi:hypothetical protein
MIHFHGSSGGSGTRGANQGCCFVPYPMTTMNDTTRPSTYPDDRTIEPELVLEDTWDLDEVSAVIRSKSDHEATPAFLFLGKKEAGLLREHLAEVFGNDAVSTLKDTYFMGLEVIEIECDSFFLTGGRKTIRTLQDPISRRPAWRDQETDARWQFRL